jgi:hypothetical protein
MRDDVVYGEDSQRYAFVIHNRQSAHLLVCHGVQSLMDFVLRLAQDYIFCGYLPHSEFSRQTVSGSHGDADIPIRDNSLNFRSFPTTGNIPQLFTHRSSTAAPTFVSMLQHTADGVMTSFTFIASLPF